MWFRFKRITQNLDEWHHLYDNSGTKVASTQLFMEDCPGVNALCFKGIVVWLGQEQLRRPSPTEGRKRRCLISSSALQMGISGLSPQFRPTLLVFYGYLTNDQNLETYSSTHMYSLPVSVGRSLGSAGGSSSSLPLNRLQAAAGFTSEAHLGKNLLPGFLHCRLKSMPGCPRAQGSSLHLSQPTVEANWPMRGRKGERVSLLAKQPYII